MFHQRKIKIDNIINAATSCLENNLSYFISFITDFTTQDDSIEKTLLINNLYYFKEPLIYCGNASKLKKHDYTLNGNIEKKCTLFPIITPDLKCYACCGAGGYFTNTNFFYLGDLNEAKLSSICYKFSKNKIFCLIESIGLNKLAKMIGLKKTSKIQRCDLCKKLFNSRKNLIRLQGIYK